MGKRPRQGDVWWVAFPEPDGRRPGLVLTRNDAIDKLHRVTIAPLTTHIRYDLPTQVILSPAEGVKRICAVSCDNIQTIPKAALTAYMTTLDPERMSEVFMAIRYAFAMPR